MKRILKVSDLTEFAGKVVYYEMEWNRWKNFALLEACAGDFYGYSTIEAVLPNGVHAGCSIGSRDIEQGSVYVRLATPEEIESIKLSYGKVPPPFWGKEAKE